MPQTSMMAALQSGSIPGLELETQGHREAARNRAQAFLRKLRTLHGDREARLARCQEGGFGPLCDLFITVKAAKATRSPRTQPLRPAQLRAFKKAVADGDAALLRDWTQPQLQSAIRRVPSFLQLQPLAQSAVAQPDCSLAGLSSALAAKSEESFPAVEVRDLSLKLYEKTASCGDTEGALWSAYRASLLHLWNGRCDLALPHLDRLAKDPTKALKSRWDLRSRGLFWAGECGRQLGNKEVATSATSELLSSHPFTLHALLAQSRFSNQIQLVLSRPDSLMQLRSAESPELNPKLFAAEILLELKESEKAAKLLQQVAALAPPSERELRLYIGYLQNRAGDFLEKFKTLSAIFREDPGYISRATLELYYPKEDPRMQAARVIEVDPYLILSLVRQESAFNERARSSAGALGLMQVMPGTARRIERVRARDLYKPETNVRIGSKYFNGLLERYSGDTELALAAYNAGPLRVDTWAKRYPVENRLLFLDLIPFRETREYVSSIARNYFWYSTIYGDSHANPAPALPGLFQVFKSTITLPPASSSKAQVEIGR